MDDSFSIAKSHHRIMILLPSGSSVRTTEGSESHGSGSNQTPECIPGRPERLPVPRGVEDKCGDNILIEIKPIVAFLGRKRFLPFYIKQSKEENHA